MESKKLISFQTYDKMLECVRGNFYSSRDLGVLTLDLKKVQISVLVYKKCLMGLRPGFCAITRIYKSCFAQWDTAMMEQQKACCNSFIFRGAYLGKMQNLDLRGAVRFRVQLLIDP